MADATVVPGAASEVGALIAENRALTAEVSRLTTELRAVAQALHRQSPWWIATPNGIATMTLLALVVGLLAFIGARIDAATEDESGGAPPAAVAPAVPQSGSPADDDKAPDR